MKTTIFLVSLLSIGASAMPGPVWKLYKTCNANASATDAGPAASNATLINSNASARPAAGHAMTANIVARTVPTLAIAPIRRLLTDHGLSGGRLLARAHGCLDV
ncbi:hypothetical protein E4U52_004344 [Claviceps spartinae]|nr:hypothetical protein E4U52_004344 [Claviceps spartinae]